ncbi:hypothetical protein BDV98DRAFT_574404 [Pterulicium gracile]|uniref:Uncharacterized protein n=1 Tax=Pterulicium gracile TaxID=1884261 RepID=A0A5C3Q8K7_9AGAR|nr:hypothetical protein BDV98DRAFT_574404 [Pterula gracilis]
MLRKVIPVRLRVSKQSGSLELSLAIAESTRRERYSQRRDLNWKVYGVLYLSLVLLYKIANPRNITLSPSAFPTPKVAIPPTTSLVLTCLTMLVAPVHTYCMLSQCILSQRLRVFAGQHKLGLVLTVASFFLRYVEYMEDILGKTRVKERLTLHSVFTGAMLLVGIYQMWVFPSVDQDTDDEKE